ncbi:MAG: hypothetical protein A2788_02575 [Candidatus Abawacabacteria bacterium RIFCSPHIGHO2_01_FULL_46_8]|uniref:Nucleoid-associated protein n=1 Tax=Candidatus Abawacabacteria bacterium RIFCSPHIGHO2_01_FULL_46_8 TaxID=1817815 RepID=A0A1F4XM52_9BACT|nr:MAG: hypothetical protein A2788_02575 [Candidatus Abawacabacteria bacterium RIFCSPHIGHO2_01_FULL_46_8]
MFGKLKNLYELQKQAKALKEKLKQIKLSAETAGGFLKIEMNGEQKVTKVEVAPQFATLSPEKMAYDIEDVFNRLLQKVQKASAEQMKSLGGSLGLPGF